MTSNTPGSGIPDITVQVVHIEGPRKGQIDEITAARITIGRDPSNDVAYGKELRLVSRQHAEIVREGNRFLLKNLSPNGCFVNGQLVQEAYLKQGDVIAFAPGGPKVSFLYTVQAGARVKPQAAVIRPKNSPPSSATPRSSAPTLSPTNSRESAPFTIQFGTSIKSFKQASVTVGRDAANQFVVGHPRVLPKHAEVFFQNGQYYLRDISQCQATILNGRALNTDTVLQNNDVVMLGEGGPQLRYLGQGRLAEVIEQVIAPMLPGAGSESRHTKIKEPSVTDVLKSLFKK